MFKKKPKQYQYLELLKESQPDIPRRDIRLCNGDFNMLIHNFLAENLIGQREAAFCLLDQRTFECHWSSVKALAEYKKGRMKIELFYFLCSGWLDRAISAVRNTEILISWWGRQDWSKLLGMNGSDRANLIAQRFKEEVNYRSADPWPIFQRKGSKRVIYHMIHATDHAEAPNLMNRAYHKAIREKEPLEQLAFEFDQWKAHH